MSDTAEIACKCGSRNLAISQHCWVCGEDVVPTSRCVAPPEIRSTGWLEELEAAIRKLYNVIPRMAELGEDEAWLEDAVHARNQLEMIAREKRSRSSNVAGELPLVRTSKRKEIK